MAEAEQPHGCLACFGSKTSARPDPAEVRRRIAERDRRIADLERDPARASQEAAPAPLAISQ